jgi:hypothetical protein
VGIGKSAAKLAIIKIIIDGMPLMVYNIKQWAKGSETIRKE